MRIIDIIKLSLEALRGNKLRSALTMLGLFIGVFALVMLMSIGQGVQSYITGEFEQLGSNLIIVQPGKTEKKGGLNFASGVMKEKLTLSDVDYLERSATSLAAVTGVMFGPAVFKFEDQTMRQNILASNEMLTKIFSFTIERGDFFTREDDESSRRVAVLGADVVDTLFGPVDPIGRSIQINDSEFRVVGVLKRAGESLGFNLDKMALIPTRASMRLFNADRLFGIRAKAKSKSQLNDAVEEIRSMLTSKHDNTEDFTMVTQGQMMQSMTAILSMLNVALSGIAFIALLVGGIGIMNIMLVSVTERTREIGIRRAVGARKTDVLKQFLVEAVFISLLGGGSGAFSSLIITWCLFFAFPNFDMRSPFWIVGPAFVVSGLIGVVFGVWPARKASRLSTIDALRFE